MDGNTPHTMTADWVCVSCVQFNDGTVSAQQLVRGTKETCERVADMVPAVAVGRPGAVRGWLEVTPAEDWENLP